MPRRLHLFLNINLFVSSFFIPIGCQNLLHTKIFLNTSKILFVSLFPFIKPVLIFNLIFLFNNLMHLKYLQIVNHMKQIKYSRQLVQSVPGISFISTSTAACQCFPLSPFRSVILQELTSPSAKITTCTIQKYSVRF